MNPTEPNSIQDALSLIDKINADISQSKVGHLAQWKVRIGVKKPADYEITYNREKSFYINLIKKVESALASLSTLQESTSEEKPLLINKIENLLVTIDSKKEKMEENEKRVLAKDLRENLAGVTKDIQRQINNMAELSRVIKEKLENKKNEASPSLVESALTLGLNTEQIEPDLTEESIFGVSSSIEPREEVDIQSQQSSSSSVREPDVLNSLVKNLKETIQKQHPEATPDQIDQMITDALSNYLSIERNSLLKEPSPTPTNLSSLNPVSSVPIENPKDLSSSDNEPKIEPVISGKGPPPPPPPPPLIVKKTPEQLHNEQETQRLNRELASRMRFEKQAWNPNAAKIASKENEIQKIRESIEKAKGELIDLKETNDGGKLNAMIDKREKKIKTKEEEILQLEQQKEKLITFKFNSKISSGKTMRESVEKNFRTEELQMILGSYFSTLQSFDKRYENLRMGLTQEDIQECVDFYRNSAESNPIRKLAEENLSIYNSLFSFTNDGDGSFAKGLLLLIKDRKNDPTKNPEHKIQPFDASKVKKTTITRSSPKPSETNTEKPHEAAARKARERNERKEKERESNGAE